MNKKIEKPEKKKPWKKNRAKPVRTGFCPKKPNRTETGRLELVSVFFFKKIRFGCFFFYIKTEPNRKWSPLVHNVFECKKIVYCLTFFYIFYNYTMNLLSIIWCFWQFPNWILGVKNHNWFGSLMIQQSRFAYNLWLKSFNTHSLLNLGNHLWLYKFCNWWGSCKTPMRSSSFRGWWLIRKVENIGLRQHKYLHNKDKFPYGV